ncbi:histidinol dehydrogenase [Shewanella cyperi]|uniref:histidinol dehydrogenase n=1 Tax=Shewanella cyperi TaxID=2814292 RepID=UPI001A946A81|nr:histidinol dehydrogenase [Shewanella cyperi]QSX42301.1 histidinol dehydrogenase [Shewanella cyperi]
MKILNWNQLSTEAQAEALSRSPLVDEGELGKQVADIMARVRSGGDAALAALSKQFDRCQPESLRLTPSEIDAACARVSPSLKSAIALAMANIEAFHSAQQFEPLCINTMAGVRCELRSEALDSVGLYIPGGSAPLISTVLMLALPARIAGCRRRVLVSPPPLDDAIIYAARECGIDEIYQCGGAQAIAALAFGTESIAPVDKIFGPGNRYVTEAKRQLAQTPGLKTAIDMPAGPSEVLVIADAGANPAFVAADLLSQAEHGPDSQAMLVTDSDTLAGQVVAELAKQLEQLPRKAIALEALANSRIFLTQSLAQAVAVSNAYGPEHLIVQTHAPRDLLPAIRSAGSVFLGAYTPESVGDYASGTNHVLPTYGYSRTVSSLSLADFSRRFTVQELSREGLANLGQAVITLANAEALGGHAHAVAIRLQTGESPV